MTRPGVGAIAASVWLLALPWLLLVSFAPVDGYPGGVCGTPATRGLLTVAVRAFQWRRLL